MKVLVVGSGGREHALAWKIAQSPKVQKLYTAPGNPGTKNLGENVDIDPSDVSALVEFAAKKEIDLTVVGPELPLTLGVTDAFEKEGLKIFGPTKDAAELEGSKVFAKEFMDRHRIPTGKFKVADSPTQAKKIIHSGEFGFPVVIKADGLAAGKGVIVSRDRKEAHGAVETIMVEKKFGNAGNRIVVEEFLTGKEVSFIIVTDGIQVLPFVTTMDHKALCEGDQGPNTGGMGAISPSPFIDRDLFNTVIQEIVFPTIGRMFEAGRKYKGVLYIGLMLTKEGPKVLEYNCRFGDPETQPQVLRLKSDIVDIFIGSLEEKLMEGQVEWSRKPSACVVLASGGYPEKYEKGKKITGLNTIAKSPGITIFHAGTKYEKKAYYTNGGRVLNICASEDSLSNTMDKIYHAINKIKFVDMVYRKDIGVQRKEDG
ncbi:MAG: phosphoribosylamine--glycine ligase [Candidatus Aminicenantes bacterium]|jgi:phosphoribosylamine--glycine ligase